MPGLGAIELRLNHHALLGQLVGGLDLPEAFGRSALLPPLSVAWSTPCLPPRYMARLGNSRLRVGKRPLQNHLNHPPYRPGTAAGAGGAVTAAEGGEVAGPRQLAWPSIKAALLHPRLTGKTIERFKEGVVDLPGRGPSITHTSPSLPPPPYLFLPQSPLPAPPSSSHVSTGAFDSSMRKLQTVGGWSDKAQVEAAFEEMLGGGAVLGGGGGRGCGTSGAPGHVAEARRHCASSRLRH